MFQELGLGFVKVKPEFKARRLSKYEEQDFEGSVFLGKSLTDELLDSI